MLVEQKFSSPAPPHAQTRPITPPPQGHLPREDAGV